MSGRCPAACYGVLFLYLGSGRVAKQAGGRGHSPCWRLLNSPSRQAAYIHTGTEERCHRTSPRSAARHAYIGQVSYLPMPCRGRLPSLLHKNRKPQQLPIRKQYRGTRQTLTYSVPGRDIGTCDVYLLQIAGLSFTTSSSTFTILHYLPIEIH